MDNDLAAQGWTAPPPPERIVTAPITPDNPPWNSWVALGYWLLSVLFIVVVPAVFLFPYVLAQGVDLKNQPAVMEFIRTDQTAIILQLAPIILAHLLTIGAGWLIVTRLNRYSFRETLGWHMNGFRWWYAIFITIFFFGLALSLTSIFGRVENEFEKLIQASRVAVYLVAFLATFTAPLVEEVVYRGVLYSAFQRRLGFTFAVILVTVLFTIVHVPQYSLNNVPDYATVITLLCLSLVLTLIRGWTGNLLPCIILHTVFNGVQAIALIVEPFVQSTSEPTVAPTGFLLHLLQ